ncbi:MAG TPA: hypothetical protein VMH28_30225 [Candidatus Acidoferrales bacterium]|nr:hypothetical protein [Candidatus Acidoferrales bacterium]
MKKLVAWLSVAVPLAHAQSILGPNLIVNGGAEAGPAGTGITNIVGSVPGWTRTGNATVLPYDLTGYVLLSDPAPQDHAFQYFAGGSGVSTFAQDIDVSSGASLISTGNIRFTASAFLGGRVAGAGAPIQMVVAFKNSAGQTFSSTQIGPGGYGGVGLSQQQAVGLVPSGTTRITVTLTSNNLYGVADSLSLVLAQLGTDPGPVLGVNMIANGDAESGPSATRANSTLYVPGWSTAENTSVCPYGGTGWIAATDPGPPDRGVNLFCGGTTNASMYQDLDVSPAASLTDAGKVTYTVSAWLGGTAGTSSPTLTYEFFDWSGKQLAPTAKLGPSSHTGSGLVPASQSDTLPAGTRRVHISLTFPNSFYTADDISFTLSAATPPIIKSIISASAFGASTAIAPGSWIEIYGTNLASHSRSWTGADIVNGVAPIALDGVSVSIGGVPAFLDYISGGQINALVASTAPTGNIAVTVTNSNGASNSFQVTVNPTQPGLLAPSSFTIGGKQYVAAFFNDGQTFVLPQGAIAGVTSRPAKPGDVITIYGVGFGPVSGGLTAGTVVTQLNSLNTPVQFLFGTSPAASLAYDGLAPNNIGLYQFNIVVPNVTADNAMPFSVNLGGAAGPQKLYIAVGN